MALMTNLGELDLVIEADVDVLATPDLLVEVESILGIVVILGDLLDVEVGVGACCHVVGDLRISQVVCRVYLYHSLVNFFVAKLPLLDSSCKFFCTANSLFSPARVFSCTATPSLCPCMAKRTKMLH